MTCPHCWDWRVEYVIRAIDDEGAVCWTEAPCSVCGRFWEDGATPIPPDGGPDTPEAA